MIPLIVASLAGVAGFLAVPDLRGKSGDQVLAATGINGSWVVGLLAFTAAGFALLMWYRGR